MEDTMPHLMPHLAVPEDTFRRLGAKAVALNISVDDRLNPPQATRLQPQWLGGFLP
jgi:hypothetical protein